MIHCSILFHYSISFIETFFKIPSAVLVVWVRYFLTNCICFEDLYTVGN